MKPIGKAMQINHYYRMNAMEVGCSERDVISFGDEEVTVNGIYDYLAALKINFISIPDYRN
jgi:hypothetical protein